MTTLLPTQSLFDPTKSWSVSHVHPYDGQLPQSNGQITPALTAFNQPDNSESGPRMPVTLFPGIFSSLLAKNIRSKTTVNINIILKQLDRLKLVSNLIFLLTDQSVSCNNDSHHQRNSPSPPKTWSESFQKLILDHYH